jgi:hypothetical protein
MSYGPSSRRPSSRGIIGSAVAGVLALVGIVFAALSCSSPGPTTPSGATTTVVPVTVPVVPPPVVVTQVPQPTVVVSVSPVYVPPKSVNSGSGGAADPDAGGLDTGTVVLLIGGALLVLGGGVALARRRVS